MQYLIRIRQWLHSIHHPRRIWIWAGHQCHATGTSLWIGQLSMCSRTPTALQSMALLVRLLRAKRDFQRKKRKGHGEYKVTMYPTIIGCSTEWRLSGRTQRRRTSSSMRHAKRRRFQDLICTRRSGIGPQTPKASFSKARGWHSLTRYSRRRKGNRSDLALMSCLNIGLRALWGKIQKKDNSSERRSTKAYKLLVSSIISTS